MSENGAAPNTYVVEIIRTRDSLKITRLVFLQLFHRISLKKILMNPNYIVPDGSFKVVAI